MESGRGAAWLARLLGVQEVPGSNPGGPTKELKELQILTSSRPVRSPFGGGLESNFWTPSSLFLLPLHAVLVVVMAMSCVFCDSAPQGEKNSPPLYMRITDGWPPAWLGGRAWS